MAALVAVIWGLCFVFIQASLPSPVPLLLAALRALIGGGVLATWAVVRGRGGAGPHQGRRSPVVRGFGLPAAPVLVVLSMTNAAVAFGSMYLAAGRAEAAVASILAGGQPLILAAAGWTLFGERASRRTVTGLVLALVGVAFVATTSSGATSPDGVSLALLAAAAPAAGTILMRRIGAQIDLVVTTSAQFLIGGALLLIVSALSEPWGGLDPSPAVILGLFALGVVGTGLAYLTWFWLLERIPLWQLGAALFLVPVSGFGASIVAGDRPAPVELAGIAVVLAGIGLASTNMRS